MKISIKILAVLATVSLVSCAGMNNTDQRVLSGAALGTLAGAGIGAIAGNAGTGAAIGAAAGAVGGYIIDRTTDDGY